MRAVSPARSLVLSCVALLIVGVVIVIPASTAVAYPPCDGKLPTILGTNGNDVLTGTAGDDVIVGMAGDDTIKGMGGNDTICGKNGNDTLIGGSGDDVLLGGPGTDRVSYWNAPGGVVIDLAAGTGTGDGSDRITSVENVTGSGFPDEVRGNYAVNVIRGGGVATCSPVRAATTGSSAAPGTTNYGAATEPTGCGVKTATTCCGVIWATMFSPAAEATTP